MNDKKLLREWYAIEYAPELITESKKKGGKITLKGIIQKAETKNQNGRIYPRAILQREMENYTKAINERRALGELDHPERSAVNLSEVSHLITKYFWEGNNVMGELEVLPTPKGKILTDLLEAGVMIGISSRGVGSTDKSHTNEGPVDVVNDDYQIICFDVVSEPSTPGAYLHEGRSLDLDPKKTWNKADRIWRTLNEITRK
jgi:Kyanoviridae head maturation protease